VKFAVHTGAMELGTNLYEIAYQSHQTGKFVAKDRIPTTSRKFTASQNDLSLEMLHDLNH
jgi:hypothetical protein